MHEIKFKHIRNILLIGIFFILSACSTTTHRDGPPRFNVDETKVPNATPKVEAKSKYGNLPSYHVFGKQYHVMASSKNYEEQGIASWYGTKFHGRHTTNGERYNMLAMTAAHKSLPLPTYVEVTNLRNGKKVIVRVNDRGPFEANRIIDLSYVAAKKLGMLGHGTAYVDVKAIDPTRYDKNSFDKPSYSQDFYLADNTVKLHSAQPANRVLHYASAAHHNLKSKSAVYLQVGAFKNKALAENMKVRVGKMVSSPIKVTQLTPHKNLYRVQIGPIRDVATAQGITKKLKTYGVSTKRTLEEV